MTKDAPEPGNLPDLVASAKQGDRDALGLLLQRFRPWLQLQAKANIGQPIQARLDGSDIIQQTCLSAYGAIAQFEGTSEGEFAQWLLRMHERNVLNAVDHERGAAKRDVDRELADSGPLHQAVSRESSPSRRAVRGEQRQILEAAIAQLPADQQEVVRIKYLEQATLSETAIRLGKTEDAVSGLLRRGVSELNRILKHRELM